MVEGETRLSEAGIVAIEVYFPRQCVSQRDLEEHDGVSRGKYTVGLGQDEMAFVDDAEDVVSMCMTVVRQLVQRHNVDLKNIGRLEVGTETIIDKSKAVKTALMEILGEHGNYEVEGIDTTNACYGGTSAVFNALSWMESPWWDGRNALVVCGDVAVYANGPARPTGGAGAVALLFGRENPPVRFEIGARATHMENTYDFFKPRLDQEYPTVNGAETLSCYLRALDRCYAKLRKRLGGGDSIDKLADYAVFHAPFNKMVRKSFARIRYNDFLVNPAQMASEELAPFLDVPEAESYTHKDLERSFIKESEALYSRMVEPSAWLAKRIGNAYTASLWSSLAALFEDRADDLLGKRVLMFSYGSGLASSMFTLRVTQSIADIAPRLQLRERLDARLIRTPTQYSEILQRKEDKYGKFGLASTQSPEELWPGATYLVKIDDIGRRCYSQRSASGEKELT